MPTFFFDTETELIDETTGVLAPELVCLQYAFDNAPPRILSAEHDAEEIRKVLHQALTTSTVVAHNAAFDWAVLAAWDAALVPLIFKALASEKRGRDTMLREQLIDIRDDGSPKTIRGWYTLDGIAQRRCRIQLSKGALSWRTRYGELRHTPVDEWPAPACRYAEDDVTALRAVFTAQAALYTSPDEWLQTAAAFALQLAAVFGVRTKDTTLQPLIDRLENEAAHHVQALVRQGIWNTETGSVDEKALQAIIEQACVTANRAVPRTPTGKPKKDKKTITELEQTLPELTAFSKYRYVTKILSTYCEPLRRGLVAPLVSRPNALVGSGRTSWKNPNLQNFPRQDGIRDCIVPRAGNLWLSVDYDALEVRTFAQCLLWIVGESRMAEEYRRDPDWDPHTFVGGKLLGVDYPTALQLKATDKMFKKGARQRSKAVNFGLPGGMGLEKFVEFSRDTYGVHMTMTEAADLRDFWFDLFPEVREYFKYIDYHVKKNIPFPQLVSGRLRRAFSFPETANTGFQGLAADGAKRALIAASHTCYCDRSSPLFNSRIVAFVHDEICAETPTETAAAAATALVEIMQREMEVVTPDVPSRASPALSRAWVKAAEAVYRDGVLIPWEDR